MTIDASNVATTESAGRAGPDAQKTALDTLVASARTAVAANTTYLAIGSPTNAQVTAQVRALTQQTNGIIKALGNATRILAAMQGDRSQLGATD